MNIFSSIALSLFLFLMLIFALVDIKWDAENKLNSLKNWIKRKLF